MLALECLRMNQGTVEIINGAEDLIGNGENSGVAWKPREALLDDSLCIDLAA